MLFMFLKNNLDEWWLNVIYAVKVKKGLEQGHNRSSSGPVVPIWADDFVWLFALWEVKIIRYWYLTCYQTPQVQFVYVRWDVPSFFFMGNFKCPERFWHPKNFKVTPGAEQSSGNHVSTEQDFLSFLFLSFFFKPVLNRCFLEKLLLLLSNYWNPHLRHDTSLQKGKKNQVLQFVLSILRKKESRLLWRLLDPR